MPIACIERVIVAAADLDAACERWTRAGFGVAPISSRADGMRSAMIAAGAVAIELCAAGADAPEPYASAIARGGGIVGWVWGVTEDDSRASSGSSGLKEFLPGVWTASVRADVEIEKRRRILLDTCGANPNTIEYLEHIVVMTPSLEDAIAAHESIGLPCKRIREAGKGMRQGFFKLEQTVLEIVGPAAGSPQVWGLAFMCADIERAVNSARAAGLQATEPKAAVQGGRIARIVDPLDGVAVAFMERASGA